MKSLLVMAAAPIAAIAASRGDGAEDLLSFDPKEVWLDTAVGTAALINIDFGAVREINTVFLGHVLAPAAGATWIVTGGVAGYAETTLKPSGILRAVDRPGLFPAMSHAFWTGDAVSVRYLRISVTQPAGSQPLSAGTVMAGRAFVPVWNKEWGSGRRVIDTGAVTALPGGGFAIVEGVRKGGYSWTFGDLTDEEVDRLYDLQLQVGETLPVLVVEDPDATDGQLQRIHYAKFVGLKAYERRDKNLNRWEFVVEDWA